MVRLAQAITCCLQHRETVITSVQLSQRLNIHDSRQKRTKCWTIESLISRGNKLAGRKKNIAVTFVSLKEMQETKKKHAFNNIGGSNNMKRLFS